jgi:hypothetical protein
MKEGPLPAKRGKKEKREKKTPEYIAVPPKFCPSTYFTFVIMPLLL